MQIKGSIALRYMQGQHYPLFKYIIHDVVGDYLLISIDDFNYRELIPLTRACSDQWLFFDTEYQADQYAERRLSMSDS